MLSAPMRVDGPEIDLPEVRAELERRFAGYEEALRRHDLEALHDFFWPSAQAVRYGLAEHSYGIDAIRSDRARAGPVDPQRRLQRTVITTFGRDAASVCTEFLAPGSALIGRQTQTWIRFESGWKIVAAHVSRVDGSLLSSTGPRSSA